MKLSFRTSGFSVCPIRCVRCAPLRYFWNVAILWQHDGRIPTPPTGCQEAVVRGSEIELFRVQVFSWDFTWVDRPIPLCCNDFDDFRLRLGGKRRIAWSGRRLRTLRQLFSWEFTCIWNGADLKWLPRQNNSHFKRRRNVNK